MAAPKQTIIIQALAALPVVFCYVVWRRLNAWKAETRSKIAQVLHYCTGQTNVSDTSSEYNKPTPSVFHDRHALSIKQNLAKLPTAVQQYLKKTLTLINDTDNGVNYMMHTPISIIQSLHLTQEGSCIVNDQWKPFTAHQYVFATPFRPGFVWDATSSTYHRHCCSGSDDKGMMRMLRRPLNVNIHTRDSYIDTRGELNICTMMGIMPIVTVKDNPDIDTAGLLRWLTEIPLYPSAFLPQQGSRIEWSSKSTNASASTSKSRDRNSIENTSAGNDEKELHDGGYDRGMNGPPWPKHNGTCVEATIIDRNQDGSKEVTASAEFCFDENYYIVFVRCYRVLVRESSKVPEQMMPWEARFYDYEMKDHGMIVPTRMECGWWLDGVFEKYLDARNVEFKYTFFDDV